jgi:cytoskeletal protein CcmA (bactofilin family)
MNILARNSKIVSPVAPPVKAQPPAAFPVQAPTVAAPRAQPQHSPVATRPHAGPSIIGAALTVTGQLQSAGDIQIEGKVEGDIHAQVVGVGSTAVIKGTVFGDVVESAGTIEGKIEARKAILLATARMLGDIVHHSLQIVPGAVFNGTSHPHPKAEKIERPVEALPPPKVNPSDSDA